MIQIDVFRGAVIDCFFTIVDKYLASCKDLKLKTLLIKGDNFLLLEFKIWS
jgi:hypothetical protein